MPILYDTHAHLYYSQFSAQMPEVIARAQHAGVAKIITIGTDFDSSTECLALASRFPNVYAAVGWHPSDADRAPDDWRPQLRQLATHPKVVALGETGLDYYRLPGRQAKNAAPSESALKQDQEIIQKQRRLFVQHLEVAAETRLPCVIHQRDSLEDTLATLEPFAPEVRGVFHCFADNPDTMHRVLKLGSLVSFTGILTYKNGQNIRDTLAATPMDKFMLETDTPYLAPVPHRGKSCEPAFVRETAQVAAQVKNCSLEDLGRATCATADVFFGPAFAQT